MAKQIPRRGPCPCGSGKRYKNCCEAKDKGLRPGLKARLLRPDQVPPEVQADHDELMRRYNALSAREKAMQVIWGIWGNERVVAVGDRVYHQPIQQAFPNFLIDHLKITLGREWYRAEVSKPLDQQVEIMKVVRRLYDWWHHNEKQGALAGGHRYSAAPSGDALSAMTLARDVYSLVKFKSLPPKLLNRLRHPDQYQGARYEVAVAALFARAGCKIDWQEPGKGRHCEFIATHLDTKESVGVEAKSRVRPGVHGQPGLTNLDAARQGDVENLIDRALEQAPKEDISFMIFVDANSPPVLAATPFDVPWAKRVAEHLSTKTKGTPEAPDPFNAIAVTNFSYHYVGQETMGPSSNYLFTVPLCSSRPFPSRQVMDDLLSGLRDYGNIPNPY